MACLFWHSIWHYFWHIYFDVLYWLTILLGIYSDILSGILAGIQSAILSSILSEILTVWQKSGSAYWDLELAVEDEEEKENKKEEEENAILIKSDLHLAGGDIYIYIYEKSYNFVKVLCHVWLVRHWCISAGFDPYTEAMSLALSITTFTKLDDPPSRPSEHP